MRRPYADVVALVVFAASVPTGRHRFGVVFGGISEICVGICVGIFSVHLLSEARSVARSLVC